MSDYSFLDNTIARLQEEYDKSKEKTDKLLEEINERAKKTRPYMASQANWWSFSLPSKES